MKHHVSSALLLILMATLSIVYANPAPILFSLPAIGIVFMIEWLNHQSRHPQKGKKSAFLEHLHDN